MEMKESSHLQRSLLVKKCIRRKYSGDAILELLERINAFPEEEREAEALRIMAEMEDQIGNEGL